MRRKVFQLVLIMTATLLCLNACYKNNAGISLQFQNNMTKQFLEDAEMPMEVYDNFSAAIQGDKKAQEWLDKYDDINKSSYFSVLDAVFPYRNTQNTYLENECYYNIGMFYYDGDEKISFKQNKEKAFYWLNLSADKGSYNGAIKAGDLTQSGDGIPMNQKMAFDFYEEALKIKIKGTAYERLAYCYENGIGTDIDKQKAQEYYFLSTLDGNPQGLYKLSDFSGISGTQALLFSKAASSLDYSAGYFAMAYGGLEGYSAEDPKLNLIKRLTEVWDNGTDPVAVQLKESIRENQYFPKEFVEALIKTSYTYSYHAFAEKYGIMPNRGFEDGKNIQFDLPEDETEFVKRHLEYDEYAFYELDFDGDGLDEIGLPLHSGAGGAFMADGFGIFKKNNKGLFEQYAYGPDCSLRDAMRLIQYDGRIYFITNPFSDTMNEPNNITARVIDENGKGHEININCNEYQPKEIMTKVYANDNGDEYKSFMTELMAQAHEAIAATKRCGMYNPNITWQVKSTEEPQDVSPDFLPEDVYFAADINNDGEKEFVRKGHMITQSKYYNDYNLFQIYENESELSENPKPISDILPYDEYYGLHSGGNLYDILPIGGKVVQFWTREKDNQTYCAALTRNGFLYSLQVYIMQNKKAMPACHSLLFDEVQNVEIIFSKD